MRSQLELIQRAVEQYERDNETLTRFRKRFSDSDNLWEIMLIKIKNDVEPYTFESKDGKKKYSVKYCRPHNYINRCGMIIYEELEDKSVNLGTYDFYEDKVPDESQQEFMIALREYEDLLLDDFAKTAKKYLETSLETLCKYEGDLNVVEVKVD